MVIQPNELTQKFMDMASGFMFKQGLSTGYHVLDEHISIIKGYMMIITGYPSSGKSEFLDAMLINLSIEADWRTMYYSPENHPIELHMAKLAEKFIGKKITDFQFGDLNKALDYLQKHFVWIDPEVPTINDILKRAKEEKETNGLDCLVIDPWNAVSHNRESNLIHEYLGNQLTKIIKFARDNDVLISIVAHPKNPIKDKTTGKFDMPTLYDISDGAMWRNKADYGVIVHRQDMQKNEVDISIQKIKQKFMGKVGMAKLDYDYFNSGRFKCKSSPDFSLPSDIIPLF